VSSKIKGDFEVGRNIKIGGGSPGVGKVLTSDASGNGTWETPVTGTVGDTGATGATGATGLKGDTGPSGLSSEEILLGGDWNSPSDKYPINGAVDVLCDDDFTVSMATTV
jgi:hypothetical protein